MSDKPKFDPEDLQRTSAQQRLTLDAPVQVLRQPGQDGPVTASRAHRLVDGQCVTCRTTASRNFNPTEPREPHSGKWIGTGALVRAALKIGKSTLHLEHHGSDEHGDAHVSLHDEPGSRCTSPRRINAPEEDR